MEFVLTVALILIAYQLTVNTKNRSEIKYLRNQVLKMSEKVLETNQHYEMILLYGKARKTKTEEDFKEEEDLERQRPGQAADQALNEGSGF